MAEVYELGDTAPRQPCPLERRKCPRCEEYASGSALFCENCGMALTVQAAEAYTEADRPADQVRVENVELTTKVREQETRIHNLEVREKKFEAAAHTKIGSLTDDYQAKPESQDVPTETIVKHRDGVMHVECRIHNCKSGELVRKGTEKCDRSGAKLDWTRTDNIVA